jgi:PhzF family phenazine biosynthesis protein
MLRLPEDAMGADPLWVDTGSEQLVIPVTRPEHVRAARPDAELLARFGGHPSQVDRCHAYVWARTSSEEVLARFFFLAGGVREDPATGSACANLGGWMIATGAALPARVRVHQGEAVHRPSLLSLTVDEQKRVFVGGHVVEVGRGTMSI